MSDLELRRSPAWYKFLSLPSLPLPLRSNMATFIFIKKILRTRRPKITLAMQANRLPATQLISRKLGAILPCAPTFFFFSLALLSVFPFLIGCCDWLRCHLCCWVGRCVFPRIYPLPCQHFELSLALLNIFLLRICRYDYAIFCFSLLMECAQPLIRADVCK